MQIQKTHIARCASETVENFVFPIIGVLTMQNIESSKVPHTETFSL